MKLDLPITGILVLTLLFLSIPLKSVPEPSSLQPGYKLAGWTVLGLGACLFGGDLAGNVISQGVLWVADREFLQQQFGTIDLTKIAVMLKVLSYIEFRHLIKWLLRPDIQFGQKGHAGVAYYLGTKLELITTILFNMWVLLTQQYPSLTTVSNGETIIHKEVNSFLYYLSLSVYFAVGYLSWHIGQRFANQFIQYDPASPLTSVVAITAIGFPVAYLGAQWFGKPMAEKLLRTAGIYDDTYADECEYSYRTGDKVALYGQSASAFAQFYDERTHYVTFVGAIATMYLAVALNLFLREGKTLAQADAAKSSVTIGQLFHHWATDNTPYYCDPLEGSYVTDINSSTVVGLLVKLYRLIVPLSCRRNDGYVPF